MDDYIIRRTPKKFKYFPMTKINLWKWKTMKCRNRNKKSLCLTDSQLCLVAKCDCLPAILEQDPGILDCSDDHYHDATVWSDTTQD